MLPKRVAGRSHTLIKVPNATHPRSFSAKLGQEPEAELVLA